MLAFSHFIPVLCSFSLKYLLCILSTLSISMCILCFVCYASNSRTAATPIVFRYTIVSNVPYLTCTERWTALVWTCYLFHPCMGVYICVYLDSHIFFSFSLTLFHSLFLFASMRDSNHTKLFNFKICYGKWRYVCVFVYSVHAILVIFDMENHTNIILNPNGMFVCMCKNKENFHKS